ncbi:MAG TPA: DNA translocase FtsK [Candidatus Paceibacterota bacterium]|nr:DNA translocase FtsK [Candidatus Paceibacterota bacterium]
MSKNKNFKEQPEKVKEPRLKKETKKTAAGLICFGISLLIILSFFELAGPLGQNIYQAFFFLFGWLYFFSPIILIIAGFIFIGSFRKHIYSGTLIGLLCFSLGLLGILDIFQPLAGGFLGRLLGEMEKVMGFWGSLLFYFILSLIGLVFALEYSWKPRTKEAKEEAKIEPVKNIVIKNGGETVKEEPKIKEPKLETLVNAKQERAKREKIIGNWNFPPLDLLESDTGKPTSGDIKANLNIIKRTLGTFGIMVEMDEVQVGPTVTRYTLKPAEGVKLSKIMALQNDLSLALAAHPIRIEAPIPGKSLVGIEVPNKSKTIVKLRNLLSLEKFLDSGFLSFPLGRDVSGEPVFSDLAKLPHLLIAGSTGSGKSVSIHSLIISLLYKNTPETLRLLLIDPKRVELSIYNGLPHLISDVIINPKKTIMALRWAVAEMDERYNKLLQAGARDIGSYNQKMIKSKGQLMPYIVIVIDELADLMAAYGREVEGSIVRLAQMARATGIHLIVSTQRPSVEVITGLIKANITSRIALQVASQIDSRTILDTSGAEKLLGNGDLLYLAAETSKPRRIQSGFVSEAEVSRINKFIIENNEEYLLENGDKEEFEEKLEQNFNLPTDAEKMSDEFDLDELYPDAYKEVVEAGKASASFLQRRLRVGYARAARLLDLLEERGVIGPGDGAKPRDVLLKPENGNVRAVETDDEEETENENAEINGEPTETSEDKEDIKDLP